MCESCLTFNPEFVTASGKKVTYRTYAVGQMRDRVKDLIKNQGIKKPHLPQVEIVEFDIDDDNPDAIAEPQIECYTGQSDDVKDQMKAIENILPRHCFDIFAKWTGVCGRIKMSDEELAQEYRCSISRIRFICEKSMIVLKEELAGWDSEILEYNNNQQRNKGKRVIRKPILEDGWK